MPESTNRKAEILRSAARSMLEHGYDGASMDRIAEEAGVTKPGLYYHFESKAELLAAVMGFAMDELERETRAALEGVEGPVPRLRAILHTHASMICSDHDRAFTLLITTELDSLRPRDRRAVAERLRTYLNTVRSSLEELEAAGLLRPGLDPTVAAHTLLGAVAWLSFWFRPNGRLDGPTVASQVTEMALAAVVPDAHRHGDPVRR